MTFSRFRSACLQDARLLLSTLAVSALAGCATAPKPPPGVTTWRDIPYAHASGHDLLLDLYVPTAGIPDGHGPRPVIVFFHSGGWRVGSKAEAVERRVTALVGETGYAVASVNYRLSQVARFPAPVIDGKTAVRWLRANARRYNIDPHRVGVMGFSAGGHLAAMLGVTAGVAALEDPGMGNPKESSRVQAVCDVSGPVDLNIPTDSLVGKFSVFGELGGTAPSKPDLVRQADPSLYARAGDPPFLIIQGENDGLVVPAHARKLYDALKAKGVDATLDLVPGGGHVPYGDEQQRTAREFFQRVFGRP